MTDFVITEHDIELLNDPAMDKKKIWARIRSRQLSEALKAERERVVDSLITTFSKRMVKGGTKICTIFTRKEVLCRINKMRSEQP